MRNTVQWVGWLPGSLLSRLDPRYWRQLTTSTTAGNLTELALRRSLECRDWRVVGGRTRPAKSDANCRQEPTEARRILWMAIAQSLVTNETPGDYNIPFGRIRTIYKIVTV